MIFMQCTGIAVVHRGMADRPPGYDFICRLIEFHDGNFDNFNIFIREYEPELEGFPHGPRDYGPDVYNWF